MEDQNLVDAATADLAVRIAWYVVAIVTSGVLSMIGTLLWGRGGYKRVKKRLDALEAEAGKPVINQVINVPGGDPLERERQLRDAIASKTFRDLREAIRDLPQEPLGAGHTYATLPNGTNIVTMADGTIRLAMPVELSASFRVKPPTVSARLTVADDD